MDEAFGPDVPRHLVFLHGWGLNRDSLRGIALLFQHVFRVHLIDLPGFGDAPAPPPDWDTVHYADLVDRYLAERLSGSVVLVGHSFGGRVSLRLAARRQPQVRGVVLLGVPGLPAGGWSRARVRRMAIRGLRRAFVALRPFTGPALVEWHTRTYGSKDYLAAGELRQVLVRTVNEDLTESARQSACPFLLVYGTHDTETPPWLGVRYRELMPGRATLHLLPHKDHHLYTGTGAHLCAFIIQRWLESLDADVRAEAHAAG